MKSLDELEAIARAATPGEWMNISHSWSDVSIYVDGKRIAKLSIGDVAEEDSQDALEAQMDADAAHIAAMSPDTTLKLIADARRYRWLRQDTRPCDKVEFVSVNNGVGAFGAATEDDLDAVIDAALSAQAGEGGKG